MTHHDGVCPTSVVRRVWVFGSIASLGILAACAAPNQPAPVEGVTEVAMEGIAFVPKTVTINVGDSVRWTNLEGLPIAHTTTSGDPADGNAGDLWDSGNLSPGGSFTHQFDEAGEFEYFCIPHQGIAAMRNAKVIVEP